MFWQTCEQHLGLLCDEIFWLSEELVFLQTSSHSGQVSPAEEHQVWFCKMTTKFKQREKSRTSCKTDECTPNPLSEDYDCPALLDVLWPDAMGDVISSIATSKE